MLTKNEKNTTRIIILAAGTLLHTFSPVLIFLKCCSNVIYNLHILFAGKNPIDWYGEKKRHVVHVIKQKSHSTVCRLCINNNNRPSISVWR